MKAHLELRRLLNLYNIVNDEIKFIQNNEFVLGLSVNKQQYNNLIDTLYKNVYATSLDESSQLQALEELGSNRRAKLKKLLKVQ